MPPRTSWKGFLRLSLVSVPVKAFTATESGSEIRLNQLHRDCHNRVQYRKVCPTHGEVKNDEIVKGYEYAKEQYVVIDSEELAKLRPESDRSINLEGFLPADSVDPIHHSGKTYFLTPDGVAGQKPYVLLRKTMEEQGLHALARIVLSGREQLVLLRPMEELLGITILSFATSVKPKSLFTGEVVDAEFSPEEMKLTETLVSASLLKDFDFASYEDHHLTRMRELIEAKVEGKELVTSPSTEEPKILNLMEALKQSVATATSAAADPAGEDSPAAKQPAKKKAPAKKKMAKSARKRAPAAKRAQKSG